MSIDLPGITLSGQKAPPPEMKAQEKPAATQAALQARKPEEETLSKKDIDVALKSLSQAASIFNKRLSYSINDELGLVVVKIIDTETDKVIKELPAREIQRLMARLREAIGLLVDETI
jgi:flagellar protein FlaG